MKSEPITIVAQYSTMGTMLTELAEAHGVPGGLVLGNDAPNGGWTLGLLTMGGVQIDAYPAPTAYEAVRTAYVAHRRRINDMANCAFDEDDSAAEMGRS